MARCSPRMAAPVSRMPRGRSPRRVSGSSAARSSCASSAPGSSASGGRSLVTTGGYGPIAPSEVPAPGLLPPDGLERAFEVPRPEAARPFPLDDLQEQSGAVGHGFGEYLEQVAVLVPVDQDTEGQQFVPRQGQIRKPLAHVLVVGGGNR